MNPQLLVAEGAINILAALGLSFHLSLIFRDRTHSPLEKRLAFLLQVLIVLFLCRGISILAPENAFAAKLTWFASSFVCLGAVLFAEGILRRHVPLSLKLFTVAGTCFFAAHVISSEHLPAIGKLCLSVYQGVVFLWLWAIMLTRRRSELSESENRLVRGASIVACISVPLVAVDFRELLNIDFIRLAPIAALFFSRTTIKFTEHSSRREFMGDLLRTLALSAFASLVCSFMWGDFSLFPLLFVVVTALHLLFVIARSATSPRRQRLQDWLLKLIDSVEKDETKTVPEIQERVVDLVGERSLIFANEADLQDYSRDLIREYVSGETSFSLDELRRRPLSADGRRERADEARAIEQLIYILESAGMNQVHVMSRAPLCLALAYIPAFGGGTTYANELKLLRALFRLVRKDMTIAKT